MTWLRVFVWRALGLFTRRRRDSELHDEIQGHLDLLAEAHVHRGMTPGDARGAARREFGGVDQLKETYRDQRGLPLVDAVGQDFRYALRQLRKNPGFTAAAILTLALGIGANTAIFSVVDAVLLRPLAYPDPDRLVAIDESTPTRPAIPVNAMHFLSWQADSQSFDRMALIDGIAVNVTGSGEPELLIGARVSPSLFPMLGVRMQLGRAFRDDEDRVGRDHVVVLNDELWRRRFGADPNAIGRTMTLDGDSYEIIGVLARDFRFPSFRHLYSLPSTAPRPQFWKPFGIRDAERDPVGGFNNICIAKLKPGVSLSQASLELEREQVTIASQLPERIDLHALVTPLQAQIVGRSRAGLQLLLGAVGAVLLIGCVNITNLLLVRTIGRRREIALRRALGAGRGRLFRQMLVESVTLCGIGGVAGLGVAYAAIRLILIVAPADVPRLDEVALDGRMLFFTFVATTAVGLFIGLVPAWRSAGVPLMDAMNVRPGGVSAGRGAGRMRSLLVRAEVAVSVMCLIAGGLLLHSLANLLTVDRGFDVEHLVTVNVNLSGPRYRTPETRVAFRRAVIERVQALPGVSSVGVSNKLPLTGVGQNSALTLEGTTVPLFDRPIADVRPVNPDYFHTWDIPLKAGRIFEPADGDRPVALVSEFAARRAWPGEDPLGKRFRFGGNPNGPLYEVIGVVGDVRNINLDQAPAVSAYVPYWQRDAQFASLAIKTTADPAAISSAVRTAVREVDPELPAPAIRTMDEVVTESTAERRFQMNLVLLFAAAAMLLAGLGIYGVLSHAVVQRTNEIGIRLALGAEPGEVRRMVLKDAVVLVGAGLAVGVPLALVVGSSLRALLFGVTPRDVPTIAGACAVLTAAALLAAYVPARRASRVDPMVALRHE